MSSRRDNLSFVSALIFVEALGAVIFACKYFYNVADWNGFFSFIGAIIVGAIVLIPFYFIHVVIEIAETNEKILNELKAMNEKSEKEEA